MGIINISIIIIIIILILLLIFIYIRTLKGGHGNYFVRDLNLGQNNISDFNNVYDDNITTPATIKNSPWFNYEYYSEFNDIWFKQAFQIGVYNLLRNLTGSGKPDDVYDGKVFNEGDEGWRLLELPQLFANILTANNILDDNDLKLEHKLKQGRGYKIIYDHGKLPNAGHLPQLAYITLEANENFEGHHWIKSLVSDINNIEYMIQLMQNDYIEKRGVFIAFQINYMKGGFKDEHFSNIYNDSNNVNIAHLNVVRTMAEAIRAKLQNIFINYLNIDKQGGFWYCICQSDYTDTLTGNKYNKIYPELNIKQRNENGTIITDFWPISTPKWIKIYDSQNNTYTSMTEIILALMESYQQGHNLSVANSDDYGQLAKEILKIYNLEYNKKIKYDTNKTVCEENCVIQRIVPKINVDPGMHAIGRTQCKEPDGLAIINITKINNFNYGQYLLERTIKKGSKGKYKKDYLDGVYFPGIKYIENDRKKKK